MAIPGTTGIRIGIRRSPRRHPQQTPVRDDSANPQNENWNDLDADGNWYPVEGAGQRVGSCRRWTRLGSLWSRLLGLLSHLRLHLGFQLSLGLAAVPLRLLELLLFRLGMVSWSCRRPDVGSGDCGASPSTGLDYAGTADSSTWRCRRPTARTAGGGRSWTRCERPVGVQPRTSAEAGSSASAESEWTHDYTGWPGRRSCRRHLPRPGAQRRDRAQF